MNDSPYYLTATMYNIIASALGLSNVEKGDQMLGSYFTGLTDAINAKISGS